MNEKLIRFFLHSTVFVFLAFILFSPYYAFVAKACFCWTLLFWLIINILKYKVNFYRGIVPRTCLNKPLLFFLLAAALSVVFSKDFYHSQSVFFERYLLYVVFYWIVVGIIREHDKLGVKDGSKKIIYFFAGAIIISGTVVGVGASFDYINKPLMFYRTWTVFGIEIYSRMLPLYLVYFMPFCFAFVLSIPKPKLTLYRDKSQGDLLKSTIQKVKDLSFESWLRVFAAISFILLIHAWIIQKSRGAWISVIAAIIILALIKKRKLAITIVLMLFIGFFFLPLRIVERANTTIDPEKWGFRMELWKNAIDIFKDNPIFGAGPDMFSKIGLHKTPSSDKILLHAHNTYLEIISEMGLVGLFAFIWIFLVFFRNILKEIKTAFDFRQTVILGLSGTIFAVLMYAFSVSIILVGTESTFYFWFLLGFAVALLKRQENNPAN